MARTASPRGRPRRRYFSRESSIADAAGPRHPRAEGESMKSVLITAALIAAAAGPSFGKTVRIPVTRGAGGVPVPCGEDPLRTCHNRWHPDIPEAAEASAGHRCDAVRDLEGSPGRAAAAAWIRRYHRRRAGPPRDRGRLLPRRGASGEAGIRAAA